MFDDYKYKKPNIRINLRFNQKHDEPMYPWEIAGFLNKLNTSYYKFELLNSICSALDNGINPSNIYIFDHSLPLYNRYANLNLLEESLAAKIFYDIGLPIPLKPTSRNYDLNLLYQAFKNINSFLYKNHVQPLRKEGLVSAYNVLKLEGLDSAEDHIISLALDRVERNQDAAARRGEKKEILTVVDIKSSLEKYNKKKNQLLIDLNYLENTDDNLKQEITDGASRENRRLTNILLAFFRNFDKTTRPLVIAKVSESEFRVLGRSLVNKKEQTGLELKEVSKNSPLKTLIEGGLSLFQTVGQERRAHELHEIEKKIKNVELETATAKKELALEILKREKLLTEIEISKKLDIHVEHTDIKSINHLPESFIKERINKAYAGENLNANKVITVQGLILDRSSTKIIDTSV